MSMNELEKIFSQWGRRYRLQRSLRWGSAGLVFGLSVGLGLSLVTVIQQMVLRHEFLILTSASGVMIAGVAAAAGFLWRLKPDYAARSFDHLFGLQERLSTAFELRAGNLADTVPHEMIQRQLQDTLKSARRIDTRQKLPLSIPRTQVILSACLLLAAALFGLFGDRFFQAAQDRRVVQEAINQEIEQIETLRAQIESDPRLTPEGQQELLQPLEEAQAGLQNAQTAEQAVSVLTTAQEKLMALTDAQDKSQGLQDAGHALSQQEGSPLQEVGENLAANNYLAAAQSLADIDPAQMSGQEQQELAAQLQEAAEALASTNPELAEQFRQAAEALHQGDAQSASQALQSAAQTLSETGQQIVQSEVASQSAGQVGQGKAQILQAGQSADGQSAQAAQDSPGTGSGSLPGQSQNGSGSGAGTGEGDSSSPGSETGSQPIGQDNGPGDGGEQLYEQIYAPTRLGGPSDARVSLPESGEAGDQVVGMGDTLPGEPGNSSVPYVDVYQYYAEFYRQAMNSDQIPIGLREFVRQYFMSLEP